MIKTIVILLVFGTINAIDAKRPFYIIGHMVNSIAEVQQFLDKGANALESDIQFHDNGTVRHIYHGSPCDCFRNCRRTAKLSDYLDHIRTITKTEKYRNKMIFQFFDLKLRNVPANRKLRAGQDMADHVIDHLWGDDINDGQQIVKVLLYINNVVDKDTVVGFMKRFRDRGMSDHLENVGFDGGMDDLQDIRKMWMSLGGEPDHFWQGDGNINCLNSVYPDIRLRKALDIRKKPREYISKVYHWTIDDVIRMHRSLRLDVDGMITNTPDRLLRVLKDSQFSQKYRLATIFDDPFEKYDVERGDDRFSHGHSLSSGY